MVSGLAASSCRIYVYDAHHAADMQLPPRYTPTRWEHNQYAVELWLQRALEAHPWRVSSLADADLIVVAANFSMWW